MCKFPPKITIKVLYAKILNHIILFWKANKKFTSDCQRWTGHSSNVNLVAGAFTMFHLKCRMGPFGFFCMECHRDLLIRDRSCWLPYNLRQRNKALVLSKSSQLEMSQVPKNLKVGGKRIKTAKPVNYRAVYFIVRSV
jgi:hypothetical protein